MKRSKITYALTSLLIVALLATGCGAKSKETAASSSKETATSSTSATSSSATETSSSTAVKPKKTQEELDALVLPQLSKDVAEDEDLVEMTTSEGTIKIKLFPALAPKAVENFLTHAKAGYYDGVIFHRVIQDFMIQGGDPQGTGRGGESIWGEEFVPEISDQLYHLDGALAMARTGLPVDQPSQGSQFYIVQNAQDQTSMAEQLMIKNDYLYPTKIKEEYKKGGTPFLDTQYSVFGQVIEGLDIVKKISETKTAAGDKPVKDITIEKINILQEAKK